MSGASFTLPINKPNTAPPKPGFVEMYMSSEGVLMVRNSDDVHAPLESARELIGKPNGLVSTNENESAGAIGTDLDLIYCHRSAGPGDTGIVPGELQVVVDSTGQPMDILIGNPRPSAPPRSLGTIYNKVSGMVLAETTVSDIYLFDPWTRPDGVFSSLVLVGTTHPDGNVNIHGMVCPGFQTVNKTEPDNRFPNHVFFLQRGVSKTVTFKHLSPDAPNIRNQIYVKGETDLVANYNDIILGVRTAPASSSAHSWVVTKL